MPGPLGDPWCGWSGRRPAGDSRVPQVVGAASLGRGDLGRGGGEGANVGPHIADGGGSDGVAAYATEDPAVRGHAGVLDVSAEDDDQPGRDGYRAGSCELHL